MLDPRIYRVGLIAVALAVVVAAFSVQAQPAGLSSALAPDAFNGQSAYKMARQLAAAEPDLAPASDGDDALATTVESDLSRYGFTPRLDTFTGQTAAGPRELENVVAVRPGMESGTIVVVAPRDAETTPSTPADTSATATLIELARDLEGETLSRTVVLASVSGSDGRAGMARLAQTLSGSIDAVLVLGDMAGAHPRQPIVIPWSDGPTVAPPVLRNTLALALDQQAALPVRSTGLGGQFVHLAFPLTLSGQGPFGARGDPAVLLSMSGQGSPSPGETLGGAGTIGSLGRAVLQTVSALQSAPAVAAPAAYLLLAGKVIPGWAISLLALGGIVPVLLTVLDAYARAARRGHAEVRWSMILLGTPIPFVLAAAILPGAKLVGLVPIAPPLPVGRGAVPLTSGGIVALVAAALAALLCLLVLGRLAGALVRRERGPAGAVAPLLGMAVAVAVAAWTVDPFAALLLVPALNLWLWGLSPEPQLRAPVRLVLVALGLVPLGLVVFYYATTLGYGLPHLLWAVALLIAGGGVGPFALVVWCAFCGCVAGAVGIALTRARGEPGRRMPRGPVVPAAVRGPATYAGPGSLGGTESALRRRPAGV